MTLIASYQPINPGPVARTITATDSVLVDVAKDGTVVGVESIGCPVDVDVLMTALRALKVTR